MTISSSVGDHTRGTYVPNKYNDVVAVQKLLNNAAKKLSNPRFRSTDPPDGKIHRDPSKSATVNAIINFQKEHLRFNRPDGVVSPGKNTIEGLNKLSVPAKKLRNTDIWDWPLMSNKIRKGKISNTFGYVRTRNGRPRPHQGWDFYAVPNTPCFSIANGTVFEIKNQGDYGKQVVIKHNLNGEIRYSHYAHLNSWSVSLGEEVYVGQQIAMTGNTGNASTMKGLDQHLHFEIRTQPRVGKGLGGRVSPIKVFEKCPLSQSVEKKITISPQELSEIVNLALRGRR